MTIEFLMYRDLLLQWRRNKILLLLVLVLPLPMQFDGWIRFTTVDAFVSVPSYNHHKLPKLQQLISLSLRKDNPDQYDFSSILDDSDDWLLFDNSIDDDDVDENSAVEFDKTDITMFPDGKSPLPSSLEDFIAAPITLDQLSEAFATNVSYFYLKNELQLSDTAMWRITYEASSALGMTTAVIRHKVEVLQETMNLTLDHVRNILERQPTILHLSADQNLAPTLLFLLRALELGRDELRELVLACPAVLCYSINTLKSKIQFFIRLMKYTIQECRELLLQKPDLLRASVTTGLIPHYQFLTSEMELSVQQLQKVVKKNPNILMYSVEENLIPKLVYYMIMRLQMNTKQIHKLLLTFPQILDCNLERTILPLTIYFVNELEFSPIEFRNILLKFPRLVTHALRKVKRTIGYFRYELDMIPTQVKKVIYRAPAILGLNLEQNIRPKVQYLQSKLDLSNDELHTVLAAMPSLLLLNSEGNLQPKIDYLSSVLVSCTDSEGINKNQFLMSSSFISVASEIDQLRDIVLRLPTLLGYSLEQRIIPRVQAILNMGLHPSCITIGIPMTQPAFDKWLLRRAIKYQDDRTTESSNAPKFLLPSAKVTSLTIANKSNSDTTEERIVHWIRERRPPQNRDS